MPEDVRPFAASCSLHRRDAGSNRHNLRRRPARRSGRWCRVPPAERGPGALFVRNILAAWHSYDVVGVAPVQRVIEHTKLAGSCMTSSTSCQLRWIISTGSWTTAARRFRWDQAV